MSGSRARRPTHMFERRRQMPHAGNNAFNQNSVAIVIVRAQNTNHSFAFCLIITGRIRIGTKKERQ